MSREAIESQLTSARERLAETERVIAEQRLRVYKLQRDRKDDTAALRSLDKLFDLKVACQVEVERLKHELSRSS